jgi:hypothetical protein
LTACNTFWTKGNTVAWDAQYKSGQGRYFPNEELVRFLGRTYGSVLHRKASGFTGIEIGSGVGGNVWALTQWGFFVYGLELSQEAIKLGNEHAKRNGFEHSKEYWQYQAPASIHLPPRCAQLVVDVQTLQHLTMDEHEIMYREIYRVLSVGGAFFTVHWCGSADAVDAAFPAHQELKAHTEAFRTVSHLLLKCGFSIQSRELSSRTYKNCVNLASWVVIEARKS